MLGRLFLLCCISIGLAPGTWMRSDVTLGFRQPISLTDINEPGAPLPLGWSLEGVWQYDGEGRAFGGFSALLALNGQTLRAFTDRNAQLTLVMPDKPQSPYRVGKALRPPRQFTRQATEKAPAGWLYDLESATRDPETGQYWLGYEIFHTIQRFDKASRPDGMRDLMGEVNWSDNSGAEALVRLADGRFVLIPESGRKVMVFPGDPVDGAQAVLLDYVSPQSGFGITDAAQLPDGRLLLLLRRVVWDLPFFEVRMAVAEMPKDGEAQELRPQFVLNLTDVVPRDNYEGLAVVERADGMVDLWIISDDNFSVFQRTLLVKLRLDPAQLRPLDETSDDAPPTDAKQKARE
ncbi:MAG: esterase-like activity of phytase family protein [Pseudomonadota bacterium]